MKFFGSSHKVKFLKIIDNYIFIYISTRRSSTLVSALFWHSPVTWKCQKVDDTKREIQVARIFLSY